MMVGWFKRIFGLEPDDEGEPQVTSDTVPLSELQKWIEERSESEFSKIQPQIEEKISALLDLRASLKEVLKDLSVAELHNPDIPEREKAIMEGNREAYIKQHKQFIAQVDISETAGCTEVAKFCRDFEDMLVALAKQTAKGHAIMNAFFANHASAVNKTIKTMGDTVSRMREMLEDGNVGVDYIDDVRKAVDALRAKKKLLEEMDQELSIYRQKLDNSVQMKDKIQKKVDELKQTDSYTEFQSGNAEREEHWKQAKQAETELDMMLSPISKAMKKYERVVVEDAALFSKYLDSPMKALEGDEGLKILPILSKMRAAIQEGSLELKEPDKSVQRIEEITRSKLEAIREAHTEAKQNIKRIDDAMRSSGVLNELDDLKYKAEHVDNQIKILQDKIDRSEKTKEKIDLDILKQEAASKLLDAFNVEVNITWDDTSQAS
ncbi:hypothetical protein KY363_02330 [Candidatus Woesearchaeota archaeon]|nr:hypothetical protein [Candidatus Woesearchaeota archaeon]